MSGERDPGAPSPGSRPPSDDPPAAPVLLEVVDVSKSYGPVRAVRDLSLDVRVGEVHAICGHNGAGKSTLVKALVGLVKPDEGVIRFDGAEVSPRNPQEAQALGPARMSQIEEARAEIVRTIRALEAAGDITVQRSDEDEYVY